MNFARYVREGIKSKLSKLGKNVLLHFDTFRRTILQEILNENLRCKLLVIDFLYIHQDAIVLEGPELTEEKLSLEIIKNKIEAAKDKKVNVDILVVLVDEAV